MSIVRGFREIAGKGNVIHLPGGGILGPGVGKIVSALGGGLGMPGLGTLMGGLNFSALSLQVGSATIKYGKFLQTCLDFLLVAWAIFLMVKLINRMKRQEASAPPAAPPRQEV